MSHSPLFSIITVTFKAESTVLPTLESVASQRCQDYEHLIVDGASPDNTLAVVRQHSNERLRINSEPDHGIYDAMNKGIALAKGEYLLFLNAGDRFHSEDTLEKLKKLIVRDEYPDIVYGQTHIVDSDGNYVADRHLQAPEVLTVESMSQGMLVCHQAFLVRREIAPKYDTQFRFSADYLWCIESLERSHKTVNSHIVIADYLACGATTRNRYKSLKERYRIMCRKYGSFRTLVNHLKFIPRFLKRRKLEKGIDAFN